MSFFISGIIVGICFISLLNGVDGGNWGQVAVMSMIIAVLGGGSIYILLKRGRF